MSQERISPALVKARLDALMSHCGLRTPAEVARMLGGERLSCTTLAHAKEMLGDAGMNSRP